MNIALSRSEAPAFPALPVKLAGRDLLLDPSGIVFDPETASLIVADLHLEKAAAFAARGQMLPPYATSETLTRLSRLVTRYRPRRLILLGDSFHSAEASLAPGSADFAAFGRIAEVCDILWIAGNHDPRPPAALAGIGAIEEDLGAIALRHAPIADGRSEMVGHFHPVARIATRAGTRRRKCFLLSGQRLLLPAFGSLTGGLDVFDPAIRAWFDPLETNALLLCGESLHALPMRVLVGP